MADGTAMIDVSAKDITVRTAKAKGSIVLDVEAFEIVKQGTCLKGDVLTTARIAAISAAKMTPTIIPMCHPLLIESVDVAFTLNRPD
jgi:cyclic pyranopterin phosphate synthase